MKPKGASGALAEAITMAEELGDGARNGASEATLWQYMICDAIAESFRDMLSACMGTSCVSNGRIEFMV